MNDRTSSCSRVRTSICRRAFIFSMPSIFLRLISSILADLRGASGLVGRTRLFSLGTSCASFCIRPVAVSLGICSVPTLTVMFSFLSAILRDLRGSCTFVSSVGSVGSPCHSCVGTCIVSSLDGLAGTLGDAAILCIRGCICTLGGVALASGALSISLTDVGVRISWSRFNLSNVSSRSCGGTPVVSVFARPPIAAVILSAGVIDGWVRYLCLNHTAPDVRRLCESTIQIVWHR